MSLTDQQRKGWDLARKYSEEAKVNIKPKKNRGREQAEAALELYKNTLTAQMQARSAPSTTTTTNAPFQYWPLAEKPSMFANLTPDAERLVKQILAGLARQNGGSLVITESDLGTEEDQIILDVNEKAGLVTITLIPDYVRIGPSEAVKDEHVLDPSQWSGNHARPLTFGTTNNTVQLYLDGKPIGPVATSWEPAVKGDTTISGTFSSAGTWQFDEVK